MTQNEFNEIFNKINNKLNSEILKNFETKFLALTDENGNLDIGTIAGFIYSESMDYSNQLLHDVLSEILVSE